jgi:hypothetical protein
MQTPASNGGVAQHRFFRQKFQKMENLASKTVFSGQKFQKMENLPEENRKILCKDLQNHFCLTVPNCKSLQRRRRITKNRKNGKKLCQKPEKRKVCHVFGTL